MKQNKSNVIISKWKIFLYLRFSQLTTIPNLSRDAGAKYLKKNFLRRERYTYILPYTGSDFFGW